MSNIERRKNFYKGILSIVMAGVVASTFSGCGKQKDNEQQDEDSITVSVNKSDYQKAADVELLRLVYGNRDPFTDLDVANDDVYDYKYILDLDGQKVIAALVGKKTYSNKIKLFDGKDAMSTAFFYKHNGDIIVPDKYINEIPEYIYTRFFRYFEPEVTYEVYKTTYHQYIVVKTLNYTVNEDYKGSKFFTQDGDTIKVKLVYSIDYFTSRHKIDGAHLIYRYQSGNGSDCENVRKENTGSFRQYTIKPNDISYGREPIKEDVTIENSRAVSLTRTRK